MTDCVSFQNFEGSDYWNIDISSTGTPETCPLGIAFTSQSELTAYVESVGGSMIGGVPPLTLAEGTLIGTAIWLLWGAAWGLAMIKRTLSSENT